MSSLVSSTSVAPAAPEGEGWLSGQSVPSILEIGVVGLFLIVLLVVMCCCRVRRMQALRVEAEEMAAHDWNTRAQQISRRLMQSATELCDSGLQVMLRVALEGPAGNRVDDNVADNGEGRRRAPPPRLSTAAAMLKPDLRADGKISFRNIVRLPPGLECGITIQDCISNVLHYDPLNQCFSKQNGFACLAMSQELRGEMKLLSFSESNAVLVPPLNDGGYDPVDPPRTSTAEDEKFVLDASRMEESCCCYRVMCLCRGHETDSYDLALLAIEYELLRTMLNVSDEDLDDAQTVRTSPLGQSEAAKKVHSWTTEKRVAIIRSALKQGWLPPAVFHAMERLVSERIRANADENGDLKQQLSEFLTLFRDAVMKVDSLGQYRAYHAMYDGVEVIETSLRVMVWKVRTALMRVAIVKWRAQQDQDFKTEADRLLTEVCNEIRTPASRTEFWRQEAIDAHLAHMHDIDDEDKDTFLRTTLTHSSSDFRKMFLKPGRPEREEAKSACCGCCLDDYPDIRRGVPSTAEKLYKQLMSFVREEFLLHFLCTRMDTDIARTLTSDFKMFMLDRLFPTRNDSDRERDDDEYSEADGDDPVLQTPRRKPTVLSGGAGSPIAIIKSDPIEQILPANTAKKGTEVRARRKPSSRRTTGDDEMTLDDIELEVHNASESLPPIIPKDCLEVIEQTAKDAIATVEQVANAEAEHLEKAVTAELLLSMPETLMQEVELQHLRALLQDAAPALREMSLAIVTLKNIIQGSRELCELARSPSSPAYGTAIQRLKDEIACLLGPATAATQNEEEDVVISDAEYQSWVPLTQVQRSLAWHVENQRRR